MPAADCGVDVAAGRTGGTISRPPAFINGGGAKRWAGAGGAFRGCGFRDGATRRVGRGSGGGTCRGGAGACRNGSGGGIVCEGNAGICGGFGGIGRLVGFGFARFDTDFTAHPITKIAATASLK
jgi:hypothetical protein